MAFSLKGLGKWFAKEGAETTIEALVMKKIIYPVFDLVGIGGEKRKADVGRLAIADREAAEVRDICVDIMYRFNMRDLRVRLEANNDHERDVLISARARGLRTGELVLVEVPNKDGTKTAMVRSSSSHSDPLGIETAEVNYQEMIAFLNLANYQARNDVSWKQFVQLLHDDTGLESFLRRLPYYRGLISKHLPQITESLVGHLRNMGIRTDESYLDEDGCEVESTPFNWRNLIPPVVILGIMGALLSVSIYGPTAIIVILLLTGAVVYQLQRS